MADSTTCSGSVFFRNDRPQHLENFPQLAQQDLAVDLQPAGESAHWRAAITHPQWGKAEVVSPRSFEPIPAMLLQLDPRLTDDDRAIAAAAATHLRITTPQASPLRDRKLLLRFLQLFLGDEGLIALDHAASKFWSRDALSEELAHAADLDIESLLAAHWIFQRSETDNRQIPQWLHTHGLTALNTLDFDILRPSPTLRQSGWDTVRAVAYVLLDQGPGMARHSMRIAYPGDPIAFVPVADFNQAARPEDLAIRGDPADPVHNTHRVILCDRCLKGEPFIPSRTLSHYEGDRMMAMFPAIATSQMADRARRTFPLYRALAAEFAGFEIQLAAKIGYPVDGRATEREHMWFDVHATGDDFLDATLTNHPRRVSSLKIGDRAKHPLALLTDWFIATPVGRITPRNMLPARILRTRGDDLRKALARRKSEPGG
jgi:hypothetical protein